MSYIWIENETQIANNGDMPEQKHHKVLKFVKSNPSLSSKEIFNGLMSSMGYATVKRILKSISAMRLMNGQSGRTSISP